MLAVWLGLAFVVGICLGSFLNVCVYRLPRDRSPVDGRSRCPACGSVLAWYDNLPVLSYLVLGGRCRDCGEGISREYLLGELVGGTVMAISAWVWLSGPRPDPLNFVFSGLFVLVTLAVARIDWEFAIIPNELSYGMILSGLLLGPVPHYPLSLGWSFPAWDQFILAVVGTLTGGGIFWLLAVLSPLLYGRPALGMGDVKIMAAFGAWLGPGLVLFTMIVGSLLGAAIGTAVVWSRGQSLRTEIPFGPFLCGAAVLALVVGPDVIAWYLGLM